MSRNLIIFAVLLAAGCTQPAEEVSYDTARAERREIVVSVQAAGVIEPETTVEVKSKASGEILQITVDTGDFVDAGALLVQIDKRTPRNMLAQAQAELEAAQARRTIAESQTRRSKSLYETKTITDTDYEQTLLEFANAKADVVRGEVAVENARIAMDDTDVKAPISGTVIDKPVEEGQVISSPTQDVGGGTILLMMADLGTVEVQTLVDETDIGKISAGLPATVTVAAYPNQPFSGEVLKIEPQALVEQNVTMFPVLITLENRAGLLRPGMNAEVEITIASRRDVLAIPTMALRTPRDVASSAVLLGLQEQQIRAQLSNSAPAGGSGSVIAQAAAAETMTMRGRTIELPAGVKAEEIRAIMAKRQGGQELTAGERRTMRSVFSGMGPGGDGGNRGGGQPDSDYEFGGDFWVLVKRGGEPVALNVRTGLTDLDVSEIVEGLKEGDEVYLLPSAGLAERQQQFQNFLSRRIGGVPGISQRPGGQ